ncbi:hypothetical protein RUM43_003187 [Polyplax serrata]|uniref:Uncharacterized protein n=1 Tax=Polyplax serrata TaxID=468196 RepID=A0AAN8NW77_POLSC
MHTPECSVVLSLPSTIAKDTEVDEEGNVVKEPTSNHILSVSSKEDHENVSNGFLGHCISKTIPPRAVKGVSAVRPVQKPVPTLLNLKYLPEKDNHRTRSKLLPRNRND